MIEGLLGLLTCQLVGELLTRTLHLRLPGPVVGMLLLLAVLAWRRPAADHPVLRAADRVLDELPLLFIPAGVGIVTCVALIREQWLVVTAGMLVPWAAGLLATAAAAAVVRRALDPGSRLAGEADELAREAERIEGLELDEADR